MVRKFLVFLNPVFAKFADFLILEMPQIRTQRAAVSARCSTVQFSHPFSKQMPVITIWLTLQHHFSHLNLTFECKNPSAAATQNSS
jgi:hypothetical protein